jgi:hypothetical protein
MRRAWADVDRRLAGVPSASASSRKHRSAFIFAPPAGCDIALALA